MSVRYSKCFNSFHLVVTIYSDTIIFMLKDAYAKKRFDPGPIVIVPREKHLAKHSMTYLTSLGGPQRSRTSTILANRICAQLLIDNKKSFAIYRFFESYIKKSCIIFYLRQWRLRFPGHKMQSVAPIRILDWSELSIGLMAKKPRLEGPVCKNAELTPTLTKNHFQRVSTEIRIRNPRANTLHSQRRAQISDYFGFQAALFEL